MLLNFLWFGLILLAFVSDLLTGMPFSSGMDGLSGARAGLELALTLAGPVCLWSGLSQAMERAGLTEGLCTALRPVLRRLFPVCAKDSSLCGNLAANLLGLGNAATPLGIRTAQRMQALSGGGGASDELCLLVVMNTASLQLIPSTVAAVRAQLGKRQACVLCHAQRKVSDLVRDALKSRLYIFFNRVIEVGLHADIFARFILYDSCFRRFQRKNGTKTSDGDIAKPNKRIFAAHFV